jgi:hypothetical protein
MWDLKPLLMAGAIALPLQDQGNWQLLEYDSLPANRVEFLDRGMQVSVNQSASPIVYPLDVTTRVSRVSVSGELMNLLNVQPGSQGLAGGDDFSLKIGLVIAGDKRLNLMQRMVSAKWVRTLYGLAPEDAGIDRILFLNAVQHESNLGQQRQHPLSDLVYERNVWLLDRSGPFELHFDLELPQDVVALWLSIDGDDSRSSYSMLISSLTLEGSPITPPKRKSIIQ